MEKLYLDDLTVGQRFVSGTHTMDATEITRFAAEYDPQPFHLDDAAARATLFGGLVASGWHTAGITMRLIVGGGLPIAGGIIGTGGELLWTDTGTSGRYAAGRVRSAGDHAFAVEARPRHGRGAVSDEEPER